MIKKVISVYDEKAEIFMQPVYFNTLGEAIRAITDCILDPNHQFAKHTSDFTLFLIDEFDDVSGEFIGTPKKPLGNLVEFKKER